MYLHINKTLEPVSRVIEMRLSSADDFMCNTENLIFNTGLNMTQDVATHSLPENMVY